MGRQIRGFLCMTKCKIFDLHSFYIKRKNKNLISAFTLAEILLSLTIIGVVAAIALPSLTGNTNERAWDTQKKALHTRFSQALPLLPSLNGYGELVGNLPSATGNSVIPDNQLKDTAAESFIRDGISKVMKVTNICDSDHLADCGLPDKIISSGSNTLKLSDINNMWDFNSSMKSVVVEDKDETHEQINTKAAAFETVNGESILVYYNPYCAADLKETSWHFAQKKICANFIYDLNGKKGPNTMGKDIGFITALYAVTPNVVAPQPYASPLTGTYTKDEAFENCIKMNEEAKLPNKDELTAMFFNKALLAADRDHYWSSTAVSGKGTWYQSFNRGARTIDTDNGTFSVYCIKSVN